MNAIKKSQDSTLARAFLVSLKLKNASDITNQLELIAELGLFCLGLLESSKSCISTRFPH